MLLLTFCNLVLKNKYKCNRFDSFLNRNIDVCIYANIFSRGIQTNQTINGVQMYIKVLHRKQKKMIKHFHRKINTIYVQTEQFS